ncbi:MAG: 50S ribosomal protein L29 [Patescibacteria group bacterium]
METIDYRRKNDKELNELFLEKQNELRELRFKASEGQLKNVKLISKVRKTIASILTILNQRKFSK